MNNKTDIFNSCVLSVLTTLHLLSHTLAKIGKLTTESYKCQIRVSELLSRKIDSRWDRRQAYPIAVAVQIRTE